MPHAVRGASKLWPPCSWQTLCQADIRAEMRGSVLRNGPFTSFNSLLSWAFSHITERIGLSCIAQGTLMEEADAWCSRVAIMHLGRVAALGTPGDLKRSVGPGITSLDDVFVHYAGDTLEAGGSYREVSRRLGFWVCRCPWSTLV